MTQEKFVSSKQEKNYPDLGSERHQYDGISEVIAQWRHFVVGLKESTVFSRYLGKRLFVLKKIP